MFRQSEETEADRALRRGLRSLPVPEPSAELQARVRAALRRPTPPTPWWQRLWTPVRPALSMAACSCGAALSLLHWFTAIPIGPPRTLAFGPLNTVASAWGHERIAALDRQIEGMDLSTQTWRGRSAEEKSSPGRQHDAPPTPPEPGRTAPDRRYPKTASPNA